jgi:hypothetical protein
MDKIKARCQQAAKHNQQLLASMAAQWSGDFANWQTHLTQLLIDK